MENEALEGALTEVRDHPPRILCLPDLFLDHFVEVPDWGRARERVQATVDRGGGNMLDTPQAIHPGGNAANAAWQLARLGADVRLAGVTSATLAPLFEATLGRDGVDLSLVDAEGLSSLTTVLSVGDPPANAMMNEPGSLAGYRPERIDHAEREAIVTSDAVLVANWASMREHGTDVVRTVVEEARHGGTLSYVDAADPTERSPEDRAGLLDALAGSKPDVWAMNAHEAKAFASADETDVAARRLAERTGATVDVHAHDAAVSVGEDERVDRAAFDVGTVHRTTGAGDAFNAGNLIGHLLGLEPGERLAIAHAVAGCYVSRPERRPPTGEDVAAFVEERSAPGPPDD